MSTHGHLHGHCVHDDLIKDLWVDRWSVPIIRKREADGCRICFVSTMDGFPGQGKITSLSTRLFDVDLGLGVEF